NVVGISRGGRVLLAPSQGEEVIEGDIILFTGPLDEATAQRYGLFFTEDPDWKGQFISDQISLVEIVLAPRSTIAGKTLREIHFREKFELSILAIWREGQVIRDKLADLPLKFGDTLLLQGRHSRIKLIRREPDFLVLEEDMAPIESPKKALLAVGLTLAAVTLPIFNILPIAEAAFAAATFMVVFKCIEMDDAYTSIEWKAVFLIAGMLPLGTAMSTSGAATFLGNLLVGTVGQWGSLALAGGIFLLTTLLTQIMSGQATAVILAPIAIAAGQGIGMDPRSLAMAVAMGCSMAFITPFGHATNLLVMGPGGYTVKDFSRVGWPLTAVLFFVMLISLYLFFGI
ncbi:MAG TPA: SLC13 family permease, partial [Anaerolineales bacterium]|nr:SLC13 family permease [Anaerolineales bacterium]